MLQRSEGILTGQDSTPAKYSGTKYHTTVAALHNLPLLHIRSLFSARATRNGKCVAILGVMSGNHYYPTSVYQPHHRHPNHNSALAKFIVVLLCLISLCVSLMGQFSESTWTQKTCGFHNMTHGLKRAGLEMVLREANLVVSDSRANILMIDFAELFCM
jgi:hypothetical protein